MRIMTAHTSETDNVEAAVSDILDQLTRQLDPLNPPGRFDPDSLGPHAAGVMFYYEEFAEAGIARGICGRLPFPVIGGTTSNSAVPGSREDITLTLTVFSGDDCGFSAALGGPMDCDSSYIALEKLYRTVMDGRPAGMGERPSFFLIITPQQRDITGDDYLAALTSLSGGVPLFGASAFTHQPDFRNIKTFFNGAEYDDVPVLLAVWSKAEPRFFLPPFRTNRF